MRILFALLCLCSTHILNAIPPEEAKETTNNLRILDLLPNIVIPLAVEPGMPEDFVARSPNEVLDPSDWIYWGPKNDVEAYLKNPESLQVPLLRVKLSANVAQTGPDSFTVSIEDIKKKYPKEFEGGVHHWGNYPVLDVKALAEDKLIFMAWVGLNDPGAGWTLMFNLVYPEKKGHPNKEDRDFWKNFITNTKQLSEQDLFKASGQDLQPGYTIINVGGVKLKMTAEKRQKDGKLQVVVIPSTPDIEYQYADMNEGLLGSQWNFGKPLLKVYGRISKKNGENSQVVIDHVASVLIETVPEFSVSREEIERKKDLFVYQKP